MLEIATALEVYIFHNTEEQRKMVWCPALKEITMIITDSILLVILDYKHCAHLTYMTIQE